jgi:hypothetical protein
VAGLRDRPARIRFESDVVGAQEKDIRMAADVKMDYDEVREMAATLKEAAQRLEQLCADARRWSGRLREGAPGGRVMMRRPSARR